MKPGQRGKDCCVALRRDTSLIQCMKKPGRPTAARRRLPVQSERKLEGACRKQDLVTAALVEVRIAWFARTAAPSLALVPVTPIEYGKHVGTPPEAAVIARVPADRKSVGKGKGGSGSADLGGSGYINNNIRSHHRNSRQ